VTDVLDRYLPDREKHGALRGMLAFLAVNTTYRGPATPGSAAAELLDQRGVLVRHGQSERERGGMGAVTEHLLQMFTAAGGELRLRSKVEEILVVDGRVTGVR
ncbi:NAD(P)/FAD-dependent oxidoreductase, partial [Mycobacterium sp. ITM-2017-0098]